MHQISKYILTSGFLRQAWKNLFYSIGTPEYFAFIQLVPDLMDLRWRNKLSSILGEQQFCTKGAVSLSSAEADLDAGVTRDVPWVHNMLSTYSFVLCSFRFLNNQWELRLPMACKTLFVTYPSVLEKKLLGLIVACNNTAKH